MQEVYLSNKNTGIAHESTTLEKQTEIVNKLEDIKVLVTLPQDLTTTGSPIFADLTLSDLTPSRLVYTSAGGGAITSVSTDITSAELEELSDGSETTLHSHAAAGAGFTSKISVSLSANQSITAATTSKILFNTETYDIDNEYDNVSNYRFTATDMGYYHISATACLHAMADAKTSKLHIYVNGGAIKTSWDTSAGASNDKTGSPVIADIYLAANDYVEIFIYNSDSANKLCIGGSSETWLTIHRFA